MRDKDDSYEDQPADGENTKDASAYSREPPHGNDPDHEVSSQANLNKYAELEKRLLNLFDKLDAGQDQKPDQGSSESDTPPRIIGDYKIIQEIGKGGMGAVYEAEQISLKRKVALKILPSHLSFSQKAVLKFKREAEAGGRQSHPGIVAIYNVGEQDGLHFITQELVAGGITVNDWLDEFRENGTLPPGYFRKVALLIAKVSEALQHAHDAGVIHRDIKPSNILLTKDGAPKVTDFGLAKIEDALSLSRTGDLAGTPYYMSPEQAMGRRMGIDSRTDVYSLGVTLYEMLTLKRPFEGKTSQDILKKIMLVDPVVPSNLNPSVPRDLSLICLKAMEKMPDKRYVTMKAFGEDLERFLDGDVILAKPASMGTRMWKRIKRNPVVSASMGVAIIAILVFAVVVPWIMYMNEQTLRQQERDNAELLTAERDKAIVAQKETEEQRRLAVKERDRARIAETKAEERFNQIIRLADLRRLSELQQDADRLWPAHPENIPDLEEWLIRAETVLERFDGHRETLASLRETALPMENSGSKTWKFEDTETQWQHEMVAGLVSQLEALSDKQDGLLERMRDRLTFAETIEKRSIIDHRGAWDEAIAGIADQSECPQYDGLVIEPVIGLVPIGRDPDSGLWEFAHLQTGEIPERNADGKIVRTEEMGLIFVLIPGGTFDKGAVPPSEGNPPGSPNTDPEARLEESPVHAVALKPYFLSKYEMTQGQWLRFTGQNPSVYGVEVNIGNHQHNLLHPVENVSWEDCTEILFRLKLRLPSESEWEYAARAGTSTIFSTGDEIISLQGFANIADRYLKNNGGERFQHVESLDDGYSVHAPVGTFLQNGFGLHDVHGNVFEWCQDAYADNYENTPIDGTANSSSALDRPVRGGSWRGITFHCRSAYRGRNDVDHRYEVLGVRPAATCPLKR